MYKVIFISNFTLTNVKKLILFLHQVSSPTDVESDFYIIYWIDIKIQKQQM